MASDSPVQDGCIHHGQLIEFIRPGQNTVSTWKKKLSSSLIPSCTSGTEARSFYEELCANISDVEQQSSALCGRKRKHKSNLEEESTFGKKRGLDDVETSAGDKVHHEKDISCETLPCDTSHSFGSAQKLNGTQDTGLRISQRLKDHRQSELFRLAQNGDNEGIIALLQLGVHVNSADQFGWTASMSAAFEGHVDVLQTLVKGGADLTVSNNQGETALSLALQKHHTSVVHFIKSFQLVGIAACYSKSQSEKKDYISFFCDVCKTEFTNSDKKTHERSTVHIFNIGQKPKDDTLFIPQSNVGYRLMMKSGWCADRGLGPEGCGHKFPLKTVLKRDRKGLGNKVTEKAKITHFKPMDKLAVENVPNKNSRTANARTLSKRAQRAKEKRERQREIRLRYQLS